MQEQTNEQSPKRIGILLFNGMEEIDAIGPWEVFGWWTNHFPGDGRLGGDDLLR